MADVSLKSIAKQLNLSISTVSRALHNHPDISKETKNRVLNLASELDYHINSIAQGLKKKRTNTIGVIVPEIKHDFFAEVISGIEEITYNAGFAIVVDSQKVMRGFGGLHRVGRDLQASFRAVLVTHRHGKSACHLPMGRRFRSASANGRDRD